ncbi:hypothetical protein AVEN_211074-1, partial [Araneus ventricosus]
MHVTLVGKPCHLQSSHLSLLSMQPNPEV